jgi:hypothetical protein
MAGTIAGIRIPDSTLAGEATELIRDVNEIPAAITDGIEDRPDTTFGNGKADVLGHFVPGFQRRDFVGVILASDWTE